VRHFVERVACILQLQIVCNQKLFNPSKSIYRIRMSISSLGLANQITSDAREEKKKINGFGHHQPATAL